MGIPPADIVNFIFSRLVALAAVPLITSEGELGHNQSRLEDVFRSQAPSYVMWITADSDTRTQNKYWPRTR
jgi:hypothetical protein